MLVATLRGLMSLVGPLVAGDRLPPLLMAPWDELSQTGCTQNPNSAPSHTCDPNPGPSLAVRTTVQTLYVKKCNGT